MICTVTLNPALDRTLQVENFAVGQHARAKLFSLIPAGKGINVARGLSRLGQAPIACGLVGRGECETYRKALNEDEVRCELTSLEGITRTNTTILDPERSTTTHLREEGFSVKTDDIRRLTDHIRGVLDAHEGAKQVVFTGSLPPGISDSAFIDILQECHRAGAELTVDTSGTALRRAALSGVVDTVKPNLNELGQCLGREVGRTESIEAAREILDRVKTVLLTLGEEGAYVVRRKGVEGIRCRLKSGELQSTVGCGDAFLAGWLSAMAEGKSPLEALSWAVAAGAASARGETAVDYTRHDVEELSARCGPLQ